MTPPKHFPCSDRMCGADDCFLCHPENFDSEGTYIPDKPEEESIEDQP